MNLKRIQDSKNIKDIRIEFLGESVEIILSYLKDNPVENLTCRLDYPDNGKGVSFEEVDLYCSKINIKDYEIEEKEPDKVATVSCDKESAINLVRLFIKLGALGNSGHSFSVKLGDYSFSHDGDGGDYIKRVGEHELSSDFINSPYKWSEITKIYQKEDSSLTDKSSH